MLATIIFSVLAAAIAGSSGYYISFRFNRSNYAATNKSGDFGAPRGGFIALFSGILIGMLLVNLAGHLPIFPAKAIGPAFIVSMIVGAVAGVVGMFRGTKSRTKN